jgi:hypothetical protein
MMGFRLHMIAFTLGFGAVAVAQSSSSTWLDKPLTNWNTPGRAIPAASPGTESVAEFTRRCSLNPPQTTAGERTLADAGWVPYRVFDRQILDRDVEIIGGMAAADGMCRPMHFNVFVFVNGHLAGTLSPQPMDSRADGSIGGAVRLSAADDRIEAGFSRYQDKDALCCPSSHVTVRYRIDRTTTPPVVVPVNVRVTRP